METTIIFMVVLVLLGSGLDVNGERHSLHYIYTALSRPINRPGIHEFTAMGVLDGNLIDYFDSEHQVKVPKQTWMKTQLEKNYWEKGTQSRKSKQQWFKVNIKILRERFRQNDSDIHVLQWIHGCDVDTSANETKFLYGIDMYSYDGANFLSFDETNENWVAPSDAALQTKRKWDNLPVLKEYTKVYLKKECVTWLTNFLTFQEGASAPGKPDVFVFSREANVQTNIVLTCMATGFSSINTIIQIKRDGRVLTKGDGVQSSGVRPNGDGTYQQRDQVEISKVDESEYTCEVIHESSDLHETRVWVKEEDKSTVSIAAVVIPVLLVVVIIAIGLIVVIKKFFIGQPGKKNPPQVAPQANAPLLQKHGQPGNMNPPQVAPQATTLLLQNQGQPGNMNPPQVAPQATTLLLQNQGLHSSLDSGLSSAPGSTSGDNKEG